MNSGMDSLQLDKVKATAKKVLQSYKCERELEDRILIPLFQSMGYLDIERVHNKDESNHKSDIFVTKTAIIGFYGVQIKTFNKKNNIDNNLAFVRQIYQDADLALKYYVDDNRKSLEHFFWITMGKISAIGRNHIKNACPANILGKVTLWDVEDVILEIIKYKPALIEGLQIFELVESFKKFKNENNDVFASHFAYKIFLHQLTHRNIISAKEYIKEAIYLIENEARKTFFHRTLLHFYEQWEFVINSNKTINTRFEMPIDLIKTESIRELVKERYPDTFNLIVDLQYLQYTFQILNDYYANSPTGLSSLQVCRLLLRCGIPPDEKIEKRILRIKLEIKDENDESIDNKCSLCTGTAYSIIGLSSNAEIEKERVKNWFSSISHYNYINRFDKRGSTRQQEHGMHYTASVLLGFIDNHDTEEIDECYSVFFKDKLTNIKYKQYRSWLKFRNITQPHATAYITLSFLYYCLFVKRPHLLTNEQDKIAVKSLINALIAHLDANSTLKKLTWKFYETRDNLCSFLLSIILTNPNKRSDDLLMKNIKHLHEKVFFDIENELFDSNVDRTRGIVEAWMCYWETILFLKEQKRDISSYIIK
jgi:hypothetical protein